ncbi:hypothetical protein BG015_004053 [Linnemannia schmuckeri]|uniref:Protein YAE1 n=1 Tax=Linnemannia schmuckeri TaxID=64567 RepID=A0A9P5VD57_9FUNG|nr:hypothetical protein BG015_004053 [Linnemannia schmuckeri]
MSDPEHDNHYSMDAWEDEGGDNDDVWGNDDEVSYDRAIAQKEWDRLHENFGNTGYREGIEEGKEGTLQQGFNQGWSEGVQYGHELGRLRGLISPLLGYVRSSSSQLSQIKDKEGWITRATRVVKELVELDIAKVFDKAYFDDGRGPSSSPNKEEKDSGCCGGSADRSSGPSCCQKKGENVDAGSQPEPETLESSTPSKGCCGGGKKGSCRSNKSNSCKLEKKDDENTMESEWSSKPEQVINEYRSRVRALLLEANMEALSQTV